ncbi:hypothetical protein FIBSPDRAFT_855028 [Athelia psychrophila]|uniref:Uncharacterized protein n=1 Tax=Athelia psychrophila TaxID=1759441 RepID=A0A166PSC0_9AGAM|nr:hypothetical protein FIBSPDRAFT_855028 [Fibularhizoctonia sp. CBS 109695]
MAASSSRLSLASLSELFNVLVNTPMVPAPEAKPADLEFALIEMPARNYTHSRSTSDNTSIYSHATTSFGSARISLEAPVPVVRTYSQLEFYEPKRAASKA